VTPVNYHEAAENELLNEIGYLEQRGKGLGRRFLAEISRAERFIAQFPESAQEIQPGIRKHILQKFRYSLIYAIEMEFHTYEEVPRELATKIIDDHKAAKQAVSQ
jgi:hypothetical protein